jgi:methyl-accepting chemotaxis protein
MLGNIKIGRKLSGGFVIVALLCAFVGYWGIAAMGTINSYEETSATEIVPSLIGLDEMQVGIADLMRFSNLAILAKVKSDEDLYRKAKEEYRVNTYSEIEKGWSTYEPLPRTPEADRLWKEFGAKYETFKQADHELINLLDRGEKDRAFEVFLGKLRDHGIQVSALVEKLGGLQAEQAKENHKKSQQAFSSARLTLWAGIIIAIFVAIGLGVFLTRSLVKPLTQIAARVERARSFCITNLGNANEAMVRGDLNFKIEADNSFLEINSKDEMGMLAGSVNGIIRQTQATIASFAQAQNTLRNVIDETKSLSQASLAGQLGKRGDAGKYQGCYSELVEGINGTLDAVMAPINEAAAVLDRVAARDLSASVQGDYKGDHARIKSAINTAVQNLDEALSQVAMSAEQITSASNQISSGSQSLAQGASEQASTLEEVSASLQEMSSMTRQNTANAQQARALASDANRVAQEGTRSMQRLSEAIIKIKTSADATAKIIKTIDEIAFQTNLLALNAAVEAARAGDAGKGFAVVAEEVRNLAMRSAEAARNTANLIEESLKNAEGGVAINQEVLHHLTEINKQVDKVSEVMGEIAAASDQQKEGVEQINQAVEQINQVTQQTAANAEESASAAEELSGQAEEMLSMVGSFELSQAGAGVARGGGLRHAVSPFMGAGKGAARIPASARRVAKNGNGNGAVLAGRGRQLIPLHEAEGDVLQEF